MKEILLVSQVVPQWFVDQIKRAFNEEIAITCLTGSDITGVNKINAPKYINDSYRTKLDSWIKFSSFLKKWYKKSKIKFDIIIATSNPPFNSTTLAKTKKNTPFVFIDWDPYPQGIFSYGKSLPMKIIYKVWNIINNKYYPQIDRIVALGDSMAADIENSIKKKINIDIIPISVDTDRIRPVDRSDNSFLINNHIKSKYIVLFSGAMGYTKNIELILETAKLMRDDKTVGFVLIGSGPKYDTAREYLQFNDLDNVSLFPLQPEDIFPYSISCGDIALLPEQVKKKSTCIPSRVYSMMAAGEAIIAITHKENDLAELVCNNQLGTVIDEEEPEMLKQAIYQLLNDKNELEKCKKNSRTTAIREFDLEVVNKKYVALFSGLIN